MASRPDTSFKVRMDDPLKARIEAAARASGRSMNAEIVHRLQSSFEVDQMEGELSDLTGRVDRLQSTIDSMAEVILSAEGGAVHGLAEKLARARIISRTKKKP